MMGTEGRGKEDVNTGIVYIYSTTSRVCPEQIPGAMALYGTCFRRLHLMDTEACKDYVLAVTQTGQQGLASSSWDGLVPATENCRCIPGIEGIVDGVRDRIARRSCCRASQRPKFKCLRKRARKFKGGRGRGRDPAMTPGAGGKREETGAPIQGPSVGTGFQPFR